MKTSEIQAKFTSGYVGLMKNPSLRNNLNFFSGLTESMKSGIPRSRKSTFEKSFGAWNEAESTRDITHLISVSRRSTR